MPQVQWEEDEAVGYVRRISYVCAITFGGIIQGMRAACGSDGVSRVIDMVHVRKQHTRRNSIGVFMTVRSNRAQPSSPQ